MLNGFFVFHSGYYNTSANRLIWYVFKVDCLYEGTSTKVRYALVSPIDRLFKRCFLRALLLVPYLLYKCNKIFCKFIGAGGYFQGNE